jgi:hypothetical protein
MKQRLKELTMKIQTEEGNVSKIKSNEILMRTTNIQLMKEIDDLKKKLSLYTLPTVETERKSITSNRSNLNTFRTNILNNLY